MQGQILLLSQKALGTVYSLPAGGRVMICKDEGDGVKVCARTEDLIGPLLAVYRKGKFDAAFRALQGFVRECRSIQEGKHTVFCSPEDEE